VKKHQYRNMIFPIGDDNIKGGYFPLFSYALLAVNILVFWRQATLGPEELNVLVRTFGAIPAEIMRGENLLSLFTSMFLHGGFMHLFGNMLFLWIFADNIEATIGNARFLIFYLLGGLVAHAAHIYFNVGSTVPTVGASGAIAAVMGAYLVMFPHSQIRMLFFIFPFRIPAFLFLGFWIWQEWMQGTAALQVATAESSGVAYWAHIGGFVFGVTAGLYYRGGEKRRRQRDFV
jgi:membrane associated rhomboid family serine protease